MATISPVSATLAYTQLASGERTYLEDHAEGAIPDHSVCVISKASLREHGITDCGEQGGTYWFLSFFLFFFSLDRRQGGLATGKRRGEGYLLFGPFMKYLNLK